MKILLYTILGGGAEKLSSILCSSVLAGHNVTIVATKGKPTFFNQRDVRTLKKDIGNKTILEMFRWIPAAVKLSVLLKRQAPDLILTSGFQAVIVLLRLFGIARVPIIVILHSLPSNDIRRCSRSRARRVILRALFRLFLPHADKYVAVSKRTKNELVAAYHIDPARIRVIYNPLDLKHTAALAEEALESELADLFELPIVLHVGRLTMAKGQWHLIRSFQLIKQRFPDSKLVIIGDGELRNYLQRLAIGTGLKENVIFLGYRANPYKYMRRAVLLAFPSLWEGFPYSVIEAMACGLPVVAADCDSGPREILAPDSDSEFRTSSIEFAEYGILVPPCDGTLYSSAQPLTREERLFAEAVLRILEDPSLRKMYTEKGLQRVKDFELGRTMDSYAATIFENFDARKG
ncbi:MAG: glycosyltransferase [Bacteroidota bacterium]